MNPSYYGLQDLLHLVVSEKAAVLLLRVGKPPALVLLGEEEAIEGPALSRDNVHSILREVATAEQLRELDLCGNAKFLYTAPNKLQIARQPIPQKDPPAIALNKFAVTATMEHEEISLKIRNLAAPL